MQLGCNLRAPFLETLRHDRRHGRRHDRPRRSRSTAGHATWHSLVYRSVSRKRAPRLHASRPHSPPPSTCSPPSSSTSTATSPRLERYGARLVRSFGVRVHWVAPPLQRHFLPVNHGTRNPPQWLCATGVGCERHGSTWCSFNPASVSARRSVSVSACTVLSKLPPTTTAK